MSPTTRLATFGVLLALAAGAGAIKCWKCGQYSDGVGSITPCANRTAAKLEECPSAAKYCIVTLGVLLALAAGAGAIKCWKCGQYSDGVGSITPCANRTAAKLEECPTAAKYCIKYVSELTVVRDCVPTCSEKEWWGARTFCCDTDDCNAAYTLRPATAAFLLALAAAVAR